MPIEPGVRIGLSGAPGVGKTSLVNALCDELGVPCLQEEMREHLERTQRPLASLPPDEVAGTLLELWRGRAARERATPSFVADNACLDFAAYAAFYGCLDGRSLDDPPALLREPIEHLGLYDAIVLLPFGVLPYVRDGVRPSNPYDALRYHLIVEGLLRRHADPRRVLRLPESCTSLAERRDWVLSAIRETATLPARRPGHRTGIVHLVGAGPGDPGFLTVRARELLQIADVVAYDALVSPAVLALAGPSAELLAVGRRHGAGATPYRLHPEVLARARAGRRVVRLKAGDPLVFGRGGEEAEELAEAGIPFEIVPGVSAALGAAAAAAIPLTHRLHASAVTFATGHEAERGEGAEARPGSSRRDGTLVLFMATRKLAANLQRLVAEGRSPETPAALVAAATTPAQRIVVGTLATLARRATDLDPAAPALVIVGEVVRVRERLARLEHRASARPAGACAEEGSRAPPVSSESPAPELT